MCKSETVKAHVLNMCLKKPLYIDFIDKAYSDFSKMLDKSEKILKIGNLKLNNNIARFGLPEHVTCSCKCKGCYACKQLFQSVAISRLKNLFLIEHVLNMPEYTKKFINKMNLELGMHVAMCKYLGLKPIMRWHDSGDIYSIEYLELMLKIASLNPDVKFYTYTKNIKVWEYYKNLKNGGNIPQNFNIVSSWLYGRNNIFDFVHNFKDEFKSLKECVKKARKDRKKIFICNYNIDKIMPENREKLYKYIDKNNDVIACNKYHKACGKCTKCCSYEYVIFIKH